MPNIVYCLLAEHSLGSPLIGNNAVFYSVIGAVLLLFLLPLVLWLRGRRSDRAEPRP